MNNVICGANNHFFRAGYCVRCKKIRYILSNLNGTGSKISATFAFCVQVFASDDSFANILNLAKLQVVRCFKDRFK